MGLDLGGRRTLGLCSVSLWPLGFNWTALGMGARTSSCPCSPGLCSGTRGLRWRRRCWCSSLVPSRTTRSLSTVVSPHGWLSAPGERNQRSCDQHQSHQYPCGEHSLCLSAHRADCCFYGSFPWITFG